MKGSQVVFTAMSVLLLQLGSATITQCQASVGFTTGAPGMALSLPRQFSEQMTDAQAPATRFLAQEEEGSGEDTGSGETSSGGDGDGCPDADGDQECDVIEAGHGD